MTGGIESKLGLGLRVKPPQAKTDTLTLQRANVTRTIPKKPAGVGPGRKEDPSQYRKPKCVPVLQKKESKREQQLQQHRQSSQISRGPRSLRESEDGGGDDELLGGGARALERVSKVANTKALSRAPGYPELDKNVRVGPDVVYNYVECTPLLLWYRGQSSMVDFTKLMEKDSVEIVPISARASALLDTDNVLQSALGDTPPMSWSPNLTAMEEEEFKSEGPFIDNVKIAHSHSMEYDEIDKHAIKPFPVMQKDGTYLSKDRARVILTESETEFLLFQPGTFVPANNEELYDKTIANNTRYQKLSETIATSEAYYVDRSSQTFLERERDKATQATAVGVVDAGVYCNTYMMVDEHNRVRELEIKKRIKDEEDAIKALAQSANQAKETKQLSSSSDESEQEDDDGKTRSTVDWIRLEQEEAEEEIEPPNDISDDEFDMDSEDEFAIDVDLDELYKDREEKQRKTIPKFLPDIKPELLLLDRLISANRSGNVETEEADHDVQPEFEDPFKNFKRTLPCGSGKAAHKVIVDLQDQNNSEE